MNLLVLAYPELQDNDFRIIQNHREVHDPFFKIVRPHFTLVFAVTNFSIADFTEQIKDQIKGVKEITFTIRCAIVNKDAFSDRYHSFLVPDEGFSDLVKLHDKLYSSKLSGDLRLDIGYIPHIGIGSWMDKFECKKQVEEWNNKEMTIKGSITAIEIVSYENDIVTPVERIKLIC